MWDDQERLPGSFANRRAAAEFRVAFVFMVLALVGVVVCAAMVLSGTATIVGAGALVFVAVAAKHFFDDRLGIGIRWGKGGSGEAAVGELLEELRADGYRVEHDLDHIVPGNVDHLVRSPTRAFMVETKFRAYHDRDIPKARRDAATIARRLGISWVQPIICLATRSYGPLNVRGVIVVGLDQLLPFIRSTQP